MREGESAPLPGCGGKTAFATPGAAMRSMVTVNQHRDREGERLLRGIYGHEGHWHLTRSAGDRAALVAAVDELLGLGKGHFVNIARTDEEIDGQLNKAAEADDSGSQFPGASYEDGVRAALMWVLGLTSEVPI